MNGHFNKLTPAEAERLACLAEEAAEVIQVVGKILRHGYESTYPECGTTNRQMLEREVGDFLAIVSLMHRDWKAESITKAMLDKGKRLKNYTHHQDDK